MLRQQTCQLQSQVETPKELHPPVNINAVLSDYQHYPTSVQGLNLSLHVLGDRPPVNRDPALVPLGHSSANPRTFQEECCPHSHRKVGQPQSICGYRRSPETWLQLLSATVCEWSCVFRDLERNTPVHFPKGKPMIWFQPPKLHSRASHAHPATCPVNCQKPSPEIHWKPYASMHLEASPMFANPKMEPFPKYQPY